VEHYALRTANGLARAGKKAIAATVAGWKPNAESIPVIMRKMERALDLCTDKSAVVVVFQLFDNCSYFSRAEDGSMTPAKKKADGKFHVEGASILAPKETQYLTFKQILPIIEKVPAVRKVILSPLPRYWDKKCCSSSRHITNFGEAEYQKNLESSIFECKNNLRAFCFRHGIRDIRVLGSWQLVKREAGIFAADPVHLTEMGYNKLAEGVIEVVKDMEKKRASSDIGNPSSSSKRPRFEVESQRRGNGDRDVREDRRGERQYPHCSSSAGQESRTSYGHAGQPRHRDGYHRGHRGGGYRKFQHYKN